jgi:hypothetical protein
MPSNRTLFSAFEGFQERGVECRLFEPCALEEVLSSVRHGGLEPIVAGTIPIVKKALQVLGYQPPQPIDYPEALRRFLGRSVWRTTLGHVRERLGSPASESADAESFEAHEGPTFVKPAEHGKAFDGHVVERFGDLLKTSVFPEEMPVWASEPILSIVSEFRVYVLKRRVLGVKHYKGDYQVTPPIEFIEQMIESWVEAPAAYSLDVGMHLDSGVPRPVLIEANDGYSLGNYGLASSLYAQMIEARWEEMASEAKKDASV